MQRTAMAALGVLLVLPLTARAQNAPAPTTLFQERIAIPNRAGQPQLAAISIQSWELGNANGAAQPIPLRGFYVAHLLSGNVSANVDGQTESHGPGDFWIVTPGGMMSVTVLGEAAILQTIVASKP